MRKAIKILAVVFSVLLPIGCRTTANKNSIEVLPASSVCTESSWVNTQGEYHKVKAGETLYRICSLYKVEIKDVIRANNLNDPSKIMEGQLIYIPTKRLNSASTSSEFIWPVKGDVISNFKDTTSRGANKGIDIKLNSSQRVIAAASGEICYSGEDIKGYDKVIMIDHGKGLYSLYAYNDILLVKKGESVKAGDSISRIDKEDGVLHFEVRRDDKPLDPLIFLK